MKIYKTITDLIGRTPLLELSNYEKSHQLQARLLAKLEYFLRLIIHAADVSIRSRGWTTSS